MRKSGNRRRSRHVRRSLPACAQSLLRAAVAAAFAAVSVPFWEEAQQAQADR